MKKTYLILASLFFFLSGCSNPAASGIKNSSSSSSANDPINIQKFSDQDYYRSSYLIFPGAPDPRAQFALTGFEMSVQALPDGTSEVTLKALEPAYHDQKYVVKPGEKLYFIDRIMGDDQGGERNVGEDSAVVVDSQGNIVEQPRDFLQ